jgi:D-lactate dehydrogenase
LACAVAILPTTPDLQQLPTPNAPRMKIAVFSTKRYDRHFMEHANNGKHVLRFFEPHLTVETASLARGYDAVCVFVNDAVTAEVLDELSAEGVRLVALRCAGFNNVDIVAAKKLGIGVVRVPAYSPYATAEHAVALMLSLNRKTHRAFNRVREGNFSLEGLLGFDMHGRTAGIIGTGKIGVIVARILSGFGCTVLGFDPYKNPEAEKAGLSYVGLDELFARADIISLHAPLTADNHYLINAESLAKMKDGVMLINTSRGGLIDTLAVTEALKSGKVGYLGLDVYEEEGDIFYEDLSSTIISDDVFSRLLTFPNVLITGHQAFFTRNALDNIGQTTIENITEWEATGTSKNAVHPT